MKVAYLFPGQGSQAVGMGTALARAYPAAAQVFHHASEAVLFDVLAMCREGPKERLDETRFTQPTVLTASLAALRALEAEGAPPPFCVAGHSLGEYSALVAAGSLEIHEAVRTVHLRGQFMQEAVPVGVGSMAAVLGLPGGVVAEVCREASRPGSIVEAVNFNSPEQTVVAGHREGVERAGALLKGRGAKRVLPLAVSAPFHTSLMKPAEERLAPVLEGLAWRDPSVPVVSNVDAAPSTRAAEARDRLLRQVARPVRWVECLEWMQGQGVDVFVEIGPGAVLSGLVKRTLRGARTLGVESPEGVGVAIEALSAPPPPAPSGN